MIGIDKQRQFEIRINLIHLSVFLVLLLFSSFSAYSQNLKFTDNGQDIEENRHSDAPAPPVSLVPSRASESVEGNNIAGQLVSPGGIVISNLDEISPDSIGIMDSLSGGFSFDLWKGTPRELVTKLFPQLPNRMSSRLMRDMMRALLLSVARPPGTIPEQEVFVDLEVIVPSSRGFSMDDLDSVDPSSISAEEDFNLETSILYQRMYQLAQMGDWDNIRLVAELIPQSALNEEINIIINDLALVDGDTISVCANIEDFIKTYGNIYWQKVFAFCHLRDGNIPAAFLTIDLLRESGLEDPGFFWVAELMSGNRPITPNSLQRLTPLQLSMLRSVGRPFPDKFFQEGDPTLLRVLAKSEPIFFMNENDDEEILKERYLRAVEDRLKAAERAVGLGVLSTEILRNLYRNFNDDQANFPILENILEAENMDGLKPESDMIFEDEIQIADSELENVDNDPVEKSQNAIQDLGALPVDTVIDRANLFRLAEEQTIPTAKAEVISRAIDFARRDRGSSGPDISTMGMIFSELIINLEPSGELVWFAGNAVRALLSSGHYEEADDWLNLSRSYARTSIEASEVSAALWPIERQLIPKPSNIITPIRLKRWEESRPSGRLTEDKILLLSSFSALGEDVSLSDWRSVIGSRSRRSITMPVPQVWKGIELAALGKRTGETVVFALIALSNSGTKNVSPIILSHIIQSLIEVGFENTARRLSVEALLNRGL